MVKISVSTAGLILKRANYTHKKAVKRNTEYDVEKGMHFLNELRSMFSAQLASIDEASFHLNSAPRYAWAPKGHRAIITRPMVRGQRFSLLLCVSPTGVLGYTLVPGSVNSVIFTQFVQTLPRGLTLLLDNVSTHKATKSLTKKGHPTVRESADSRDIALKYTVPYAPHLNPVEFCFNTVRNFINRRQPRNEEKLKAVVAEALASLRAPSLDALFKRVIWGDP